MKIIVTIIACLTFGMIAGCATNGGNGQNLPENTYQPHQNNAASTAAKMISPVT
jgi:hypothetical protein